MLWLYLLGLVTGLVIILRRVLRRQKPLSDELYARQVAVDHVHSGVAWVRSDGKIGSVNESFAATFGVAPRELAGRDWYEIFPLRERERIQEAYSQMLLLGKAALEARGWLTGGSSAELEVLLVAVHDHKMRYVGHHCLVADRTRERQLEEKVRQLSAALEERTGVGRAAH